MEEGWRVLCDALYQSIREEEWNELHEKFMDVSKNLGVKKKLAWRKSLRKDFFSANKSK